MKNNLAISLLPVLVGYNICGRLSSLVCYGFAINHPKNSSRRSKSVVSTNKKPSSPKTTATKTTTASTGTRRQNPNPRHGKSQRQTTGYNFRNSGIKMKRKRPPRWEVEGDSLFLAESDTSTAATSASSCRENNDNNDNNDDEYSLSIPKFEKSFQSMIEYDTSTTESEILDRCLKKVFDQEQEQQQSIIIKSKKLDNHVDKNNNEADSKKNANFTSKMMWGSLPVGPILKSKLISIYDKNSTPTPIQEEAFKVLSKKQQQPNKSNFVIASPTGTGKTLAFCLPLISTSSIKKDERKILIVTPTVELSFQIQKVVNQLWDERAVYVMDNNTPNNNNNNNVNQIMEWNIEAMMLSKAPIIASTPKVLLQMISTITGGNNHNEHSNSRGRYKSIFSNLQTIVLDECDRLLQTELVARHNNDMMKKNAMSNNNTDGKSKKKNSKRFVNDCPTIQLLNALEQKMGVSINVQNNYPSRGSGINSSSSRVQLICASATVGRTLRHQIMELTNASSIEKGSILITADDRTGKDVIQRRSSLLPNTIEHKYVVTKSIPKIQIDDEEFLQQMKFIQSLTESMDRLNPGASIIFPGKIGVQKMVRILGDIHRFDGIQTLRDEKNYDYDATPTTTDNTVDNEEKIIATWKNVPIHVVGEKFGRGLDIPKIQYVFISSPPTSPAAYAHLAGRTGRANQDGVAITFVRDLKEAKRLIYLSKKLGINFTEFYRKSDEPVIISAGGTVNKIGEEKTVSKEEVEDVEVDPLNDLTIIQLKEMLKQRNLKVSGKKVELITRLKEAEAANE